MGMVLVSSNRHRRFQANTETRKVLSFHYLGLRAIAYRIRFTMRQWKAALKWYSPQLTPLGPQAHEVKFVGFPQTLTQFLAGEALQNILEHRFAAAKVNSEMIRLVKIDAW